MKAFHHKINNIVGYSHPKLATIIDKFKIFSIQYYHKYINKLFSDNNDNQNGANILNDIYNFLSQFLKKTNKAININLLLQVTGETKTNLEEISNRILNSLYNFNINEIDDNKDLNDQNNEEKENINDLINNWWLG